MYQQDRLAVAPKGEREIVITRDFKAPRALVFDALTKADLIEDWLTGPDGWSFCQCDIDLEPGGMFRYVWRNPEGLELGMSGKYKEIVPPALVINTELFDKDWTGGEALVTNQLEETEDGTRLVTTVRYTSGKARDDVLASEMASGLADSYERLDKVLNAHA